MLEDVYRLSNSTCGKRATGCSELVRTEPTGDTPIGVPTPKQSQLSGALQNSDVLSSMIPRQKPKMWLNHGRADGSVLGGSREVQFPEVCLLTRAGGALGALGSLQLCS